MSIELGSNTNTNTNTGHHLIQVDSSFVDEVAEMIMAEPKSLPRSAGEKICCIFKVPQSLSYYNNKAFHPQIVSIGPYHHGRQDLQTFQEHKGRFMQNLVARSEPLGIHLTDFLYAVAPLEEKIRASYSETSPFNSKELIKMMVLDSCFIIELICRVVGLVQLEQHDPFFSMAWVFPFLMRDLLLLENQIPYFVLEKLYEMSAARSIFGTSNGSPIFLARLALKFFNCMLQRPSTVLETYHGQEHNHLLDLLRLTYIPAISEEIRPPSRFLRLIASARKLHLAGVKFEPRNMGNGFLDIEFRNGVLKIPTLTIDDFTSSLLLNCIAFEQCYSHSSKCFSTYVIFMGCLINTPNDARLLNDKKIIENYIGTDEEVARLFSTVGKDVMFDIHKSHLSKVFEEVNEYYLAAFPRMRSCWNAFKDKYFDNPWSFVSALAASILLLLTTIQTFFAVYPYVHPKDK